MAKMIQIMRTGHLYQLDMAAAALKESSVPHFTREETSSGLRLAMPAAPSMFPGTWWAILVPEECADQARQVLSELPFETTINPEVWDSEMPPRHRRLLQVGAALVLLYLLWQMAWQVWRSL